MSGHWPAFQVSTAAGHVCGMQIKTFIRLRGCSQMFFFMMLRGIRGVTWRDHDDVTCGKNIVNSTTVL